MNSIPFWFSLFLSRAGFRTHSLFVRFLSLSVCLCMYLWTTKRCVCLLLFRVTALIGSHLCLFTFGVSGQFWVCMLVQQLVKPFSVESLIQQHTVSTFFYSILRWSGFWTFFGAHKKQKYETLLRRSDVGPPGFIWGSWRTYGFVG